MNESTNTTQPSPGGYRCDLCETEVPNRDKAWLLCDPEALPEAPTVYLVRACCLERFEARFGKEWERYALSSPNAGWLLPCFPARRASS